MGKSYTREKYTESSKTCLTFVFILVLNTHQYNISLNLALFSFFRLYKQKIFLIIQSKNGQTRCTKVRKKASRRVYPRFNGELTTVYTWAVQTVLFKELDLEFNFSNMILNIFLILNKFFNIYLTIIIIFYYFLKRISTTLAFHFVHL